MALTRNFKKSTRSNNGGACVEAALTEDASGVQVRDSKDVTGPQLVFGGSEWTKFLRSVNEMQP